MRPKRERPENSIYTDVTEEWINKECEETREKAYKEGANVEARLNELISEKMINLRAKIWPIMCEVPDLQEMMLLEHDAERMRRKRLISERKRYQM